MLGRIGPAGGITYQGIRGKVAMLSADAPGKVLADGAAHFSAANKEYLTIADNASLSATTTIEVGCWVYFDSLGVTRAIMVKGNLTLAANFEYGLYYTGAMAAFRFAVSNGTSIVYVTDTGATPVIGTWYFLRAGRKADGTLFIQRNNAAEVTSPGAAEIQDSNQPFRVGVDTSGSTYYMDGRVDSAYVTKTISDSATASALYNSGNGRISSDCVAANGLDTFWTNCISWWNFNAEGIRYDAKGTNHLTPASAQIINASTLNGGFETVNSTPELLSNPGFETAGGGGADVFGSWVETAGSGTITDETTTFHSGAHAAKLAFGTGQSYIGQALTVAASTTYQLVFWVYGDGTNQGRYSVYNNSGAAFITTITQVGTAVAGWTRVSQTFVTPVGCTAITIFLYSPALAGYAIFDDASVTLLQKFGSWTVSSSYVKDAYIEANTATPLTGTTSLRINGVTSSYIGVYQSVLTTGRVYKVSYSAKAASGTPNITVRDSGGTNTYVTQAITTSKATYTHYFTAVGTTVALVVAGNVGIIDLDDFTCESEGPAGGVAGIAAGVSTDANLCASFTGATQSLSIADVSQTGLDPGTSDYSYEVWIMPDSFDSSSRRVFSKGAVADGQAGWFLTYTDGTLKAYHHDGTGSRLNCTSAILSRGVWYHAVVTCDRDGLMSLYMNNGTPVTASIAAQAGDVNSADIFRLGNTTIGTTAFLGRIDAARFWNRCLTSQDVGALFNGGRALKYAGLSASLKTSLISNWDVDKAAGITADSHGTNTLINNNTVTHGQGVAYAEGQASRWLDSKGSYNFTNTTLSGFPAYQSNVLNGKPGILFDGVDDRLSNAADLIGTGDVTIAVVIKALSNGATAGRIIDNGNFSVYVATDALYYGGVGSGASTHTHGTAEIWIFTRTAGGIYSAYKNGAPMASGAGTAVAAGGPTSIGNNNGATRAFDGYMFENPIIYNRLLNGAEIKAVFKYLGAKYGITVVG
jgi:hypothetical protein